MIDLNKVGDMESNDFQLIPDNTIARAIINIKPNVETLPEFSNSPMFKFSGSSSAKWIEVEYTIIHGPFDKRKFWQNHFFDGDAKDDSGVSKSRKIGLSWLKAVLESHSNLDATDASPEAQSKRQLDPARGGLANINGMSVCVKIGIEKSSDPQYADKNRCKVILTQGMDGYIPNNTAPTAQQTPPPSQGGVVPDWANK